MKRSISKCMMNKSVHMIFKLAALLAGLNGSGQAQAPVFPYGKPPEEKPKQPLSEAMKRLYDAYDAGRAEDNELFSNFRYTPLQRRLADNPFLEKALTQVSVPFFAFSELVFLQSQPRDLVEQAAQHEVFVQAIFSKNKLQARQITRKVLMDFWKRRRSLAK